MIKLNPKGDPNKPKSQDLGQASNEGPEDGRFNIESIEDLDKFIANGNFTSFENHNLEKLSEWLKKSVTSNPDDKLNTYRAFSLALVNQLLTKATQKAANDIPPKSKENDNLQYNLPIRFNALESLFKEIEDDQLQGYATYVLLLVEKLELLERSLDEMDMDAVYKLTSEMMSAIEPYDFPQRKYIYRLIADEVNKVFLDYKFVSPEDGNVINPNFHKVIGGSGPRISKGFSYILINKETDVVIKFGNVKTI